jgi:hypothetical protein
MTEPNCAAVEGLLDLYAAGACDAREREAVAAHAAHCRDCAAALAESRRLMGLLDQRADEPARMRRLRRTIEAEAAKHRPRLVFVFSRRVASLAALLLVMVVGLLGVTGLPRPEAPVVVELTAHVSRALPEAMLDAFPPAPAPAPGTREPLVAASKRAKPILVYPLTPPDEDAEQYRRRLRAAPAGTPPPAPEVDLVLEVRNSLDDPLTLDPGAAEVVIDLNGPGVVRLPVSAPRARPILEASPPTLAPGATGRLVLRRLTAGRTGAVQNVYWTEPGDYTLRVRVRLTRGVDITTPPLAVRVEP